MPDITMCGGEGCPMREKCYRYTAPESEYRQSFFTEAPWERDDESDEVICDHFWDNKDKVNHKP
jgi:hypothetical protein